MAGCKGEKASAAEKVKDSVTSPSLIADSVVKRKTYHWWLILLVSLIVQRRVTLILLIPSLCLALNHWSIRSVLTSHLSWYGLGMTIVMRGVESKPYSNIADGKGMINYYAKNAYKSISKTLEEIDDPDVAWKPEISKFIMKLNETDRYVTYYSSFYTYSGGAHGMASEYGATFDKKVGCYAAECIESKGCKSTSTYPQNWR